MKLKVTELTIGSALPGVQKTILQENVNLYAKASRDFNPIHLDEEFAHKTPAAGRIAHGMLILAYISEMMTAAFGRAWLTDGKLNVRFKAPARPGDTVVVRGKITKVEKEGIEISAPSSTSLPAVMVACDVLVENQKGQAVITGEALIKVKEE